MALAEILRTLTEALDLRRKQEEDALRQDLEAQAGASAGSQALSDKQPIESSAAHRSAGSLVSASGLPVRVLHNLHASLAPLFEETIN